MGPSFCSTHGCIEMNITPHFRLEEFACRSGADYPDKYIQERLVPLCELLEAIRAHFGAPVKVISGYRTPTYNRSISGAKKSQHIEGRAADIIIGKIGPVFVHDEILLLHRSGAFKSRGVYIGGLGCYSNFTHVDVRPGTRLVRWALLRRSR